MKRRATTPSLFQEEEPPRYLLDTSGWLRVDELTDPIGAWTIVRAVIVQDRLFSPRRVINEVISISARISPYIDRLVRCERNDEVFLMKVGQITRRYRGMSRPTSRKTRADPFLVALAILDGYTVVAEETLAKRPMSKIPGVCKQERVTCITLAQFLLQERDAPSLLARPKATG